WYRAGCKRAGRWRARAHDSPLRWAGQPPASCQHWRRLSTAANGNRAGNSICGPGTVGRTALALSLVASSAALAGAGGCGAAAGGLALHGGRGGGRGATRSLGSLRRLRCGFVEQRNVAQGVKVLPCHALGVGDPVLVAAGI